MNLSKHMKSITFGVSFELEDQDEPTAEEVAGAFNSSDDEIDEDTLADPITNAAIRDIYPK